MEPFPFEIEYQVTLGDFRKASYYGLFLRHRRPLLVLFIVLIGAFLYCLAGLLGMGRINIFVPLLAGAYLVWGLLLFAGTEKAIRACLRQENTLVGCTYRVLFEKKQVRIRVPERSIDVFLPLSKLACAFEMSAAFLLYPNPQETYIVPVRALTDEQRLALRAHFRKTLGKRFGSRFG